MPNHHELPQYYLGGFFQPGTHYVWSFARDLPFNPGLKYGRNPRRQGLRQTAIRSDGYISWYRDGTRHFEYEALLQRQEHLADAVIAKVRAFETIDQHEKEVLARYIGLMWRRVRERDTEIFPMLEDQLAASRLSKDAWQLAIAGRIDDARGVLEELNWFRSPKGKVDLLRETMVTEFMRVHRILMQLKWNLHRAAVGAYFVTSDVPVTYDRAAGLRRSPLLFPISRDTMLVGTRWGQSDLAWFEASQDETRKLNAMVISQAKRHVYAPQPDEWILAGWTRGFNFTAQTP